MSHDDRFDLDREERIARVLRRQPRDRSVPPYSAVESRVRPRAVAPLALLAGAAVIVLAAVLGATLAERRGAVGEPSPSMSAPPSAATASPSLTATPTAAITPTPSPTPTPTPIALPGHAEISAPSRDLVWALVGGSPRLFVSTDRGNTWQERSVPGERSVREVSFISDREGWALTGGDTECENASVRLWHTSDGARTWEEITPTDVLSGRCIGSLSFIHERAGFLAVWGSGEASATLQTIDGGRTWRAIPIPDPPGFDSSGSRALLAGRVHRFGTALFVDAFAHVGVDARRRFVFVWNSNAPGWSYLAEVPDAQDAFAFAGGRGGGDLRWLLISPGGGSQESTDSGQTWHPFETAYQQAAPLAPVITFADGSVGYATVRGAIQRTTDGGRHWEPIETPGTER